MTDGQEEQIRGMKLAILIHLLLVLENKHHDKVDLDTTDVGL